MNVTDWEKSDDPLQMLTELQVMSPRKERILSLLLLEEMHPECLETHFSSVLRLADGKLTPGEQSDLRAQLSEQCRNFRSGGSPGCHEYFSTLWSLAQNDPQACSKSLLKSAIPNENRMKRRWSKRWSDVIRDLMSNPFGPSVIEEQWRSPTVLSMADVMYCEQSFVDMAILGDALEDAGCTSLEILDHCRGEGNHVRGCWVIDLLRGTEGALDYQQYFQCYQALEVSSKDWGRREALFELLKRCEMVGLAQGQRWQIDHGVAPKRNPFESGIGWTWHSSSGCSIPNECQIPWELFRRLESGDVTNVGMSFRLYPSMMLAERDLAFALARQ